ncbi:MAG: ACP S-malonyltransferase [Pseudomonadales bacterium]|nr:ACP S-malonyltransferase [Pseudomonadales bacterium]
MSNSIAFVFPGQGSQHVGMLADLAADSSTIQQCFAEASEVLGYDLWDLCQNDPDSSLAKTEITQPALLTASVSLWRLWQDRSDIQPVMMAGHSLGEYSALVCSGVLGFSDAVKLVQSRGQYMQSAVPQGEGAMAVIIGLEDDAVVAVCDEAAQGQVVAAVNYNSPGQIAIAGNAEAIERAMVIAKDKGAKRAMPLAVSVPSHCALMKPAAVQLAADLESIQINKPTITVVQNVTAEPCDSPDQIRENLIAQLYSPVRWSESVQLMAGKGIDTLVEAGPGKVLCGLAKRIDRAVTAYPIAETDSFSGALEALTAE